MDTGIWRRLIVVPFEAKIQGSGDIKNYADHLYDQAGGAILAWIMEGARLIHAEDYKLKAPRQVVEASEAYREENDWFAQFLEDCCDTGDTGASTKSGELYRTYRAWAASTGGYARSTTDFYNALERAGHRRSRTNKGSVVGGLTLKSEFDSQGNPF